MVGASDNDTATPLTGSGGESKHLSRANGAINTDIGGIKARRRDRMSLARIILAREMAETLKNLLLLHVKEGPKIRKWNFRIIWDARLKVIFTPRICHLNSLRYPHSKGQFRRNRHEHKS